MIFDDLLSDNGLFCDGDWIEKKDQDSNGLVRLIQLADIGVCEFKDKSNKFITEQKAIDLNCTYLKKGDLLIARLPEPLGRACIFPYDGKFITAVDVAILRPANDKVYNQYIMYLVNSPQFRNQIKKFESGTTRKRISRKNLNRIDFIIPDYNEQRRIVAKIEELFSQLDSGVETLKKTKAQLAVYRQAVLKEAFSPMENWEHKRLSEIGVVNLGRQRSPKNVSNNYPTKYIRAANITETGLSLTDVLDMEFTPKEKEKYLLKHGDIVVSEASGSITQVGKPAIWEEQLSECCFQNTVIRLRLYNDNSKYVYWYLKYLYVNGYYSRIVGGVGINHIGAGNFSNIEIDLAPISEQEKIVNQIESRLSV